MTRFNLTEYQIKSIKSQIDKIYEDLKVASIGEGIHADYLSLTGLFNSASREEKNIPNDNSLKSLIKVTEGYINSQKELTKAKVIQSIDAALKDAQNKDIGPSGVQDLILSNLVKVFDKASSDMRRIIDTEANGIKNMGLLDGILKVNAAYGIEDPIVYFSCVWDDLTCKECLRLHFHNGGPDFRLWKLSELKAGYAKRGDSEPSSLGQHPGCRSSLASLLPGMGFNGAGIVVYVGSGHSEINKQRGL